PHRYPGRPFRQGAILGLQSLLGQAQPPAETRTLDRAITRLARQAARVGELPHRHGARRLRARLVCGAFRVEEPRRDLANATRCHFALAGLARIVSGRAWDRPCSIGSTTFTRCLRSWCSAPPSSQFSFSASFSSVPSSAPGFTASRG